MKQISEDQFGKLRALFIQNLVDKPIKERISKPKDKRTKIVKYESKEHKELKDYVAEVPSIVLNEEGFIDN